MCKTAHMESYITFNVFNVVLCMYCEKDVNVDSLSVRRVAGLKV